MYSKVNASSNYTINISSANTQYRLTDLDIFTSYNISVASGTDIGLSADYASIVITTLNDSKASTNIFGNDVLMLYIASSVPLNVRIPHITNNSLVVMWEQPAQPNGMIHSYKVEILMK